MFNKYIKNQKSIVCGVTIGITDIDS